MTDGSVDRLAGRHLPPRRPRTQTQGPQRLRRKLPAQGVAVRVLRSSRGAARLSQFQSASRCSTTGERKAGSSLDMTSASCAHTPTPKWSPPQTKLELSRILGRLIDPSGYGSGLATAARSREYIDLAGPYGG